MTQPLNNLERISKALNDAQSELGAVVKGSDNPYYKSKYADINDVLKCVKPILNKNGITILQPVNVAEINGQLVDVVNTILIHTSGEMLSSQTRVVVGEKADAQKFGAAITYSRRFALQSIIGLPAEDDDGNAASGKKGSATKPSAKDIKKPAAKTVKPTEVVKNTKWS